MTTEKRKRKPKYPKTAAIKRLLEVILPRIQAGKISDPEFEKVLNDGIKKGYTEFCLDQEKLKESHDLALDILRCYAAGKSFPYELEKKVDDALSVLRFRSSSMGRGAAEIDYAIINNTQDWSAYYRGQLVYDVLEAYREKIVEGSKYRCVADYYISTCKRCNAPFEKKTNRQVFCGDYCQKNLNAKNEKKKNGFVLT